jgi:hypothetical protein
MASPTNFPVVVVCLPDLAVALLVNSALTRAGFAVTCTSDVAEFEDALCFGPYCAVVTTPSLQMAIRAISDIPVVELAEPQGEPAETGHGPGPLDERVLIESLLRAVGGLDPAEVNGPPRSMG